MPDAATLAPPMKPGEYLRLRRQAAGLTIAHVVTVLRPANLANVAELRQQLTRDLMFLEADTLGGPRALELADLLGAVFAYDPSVFHHLVARAKDGMNAGAPPMICTGCGCSWNDPCLGRGGPCSWARPNLCSCCTDRPSLSEGAPSHAA